MQLTYANSPGIGRSPYGQQAGLDLSSLDSVVQYYFQRGLAESTLKTYHSGISRFLRFCNLHGVASPLPVSQSLLCYYVSYLAQNGLSHQTIKTYVSAVRHLQIAKDFPEPAQYSSMPKLKVVENGIRRSRTMPSRPRLPITPEILHQI